MAPRKNPRKSVAKSTESRPHNVTLSSLLIQRAPSRKPDPTKIEMVPLHCSEDLGSNQSSCGSFPNTEGNVSINRTHDPLGFKVEPKDDIDKLVVSEPFSLFKLEPNEPSTSYMGTNGGIHPCYTATNSADSSVEETDVDITSSTTNPRNQNENGNLGSEFDDEYDVKLTLDGFFEKDFADSGDLDEPVQEIVKDIDRVMEDTIESLAGLSTTFEWTQDFGSFRAVPETFSGPAPGPVKDYDSPFDAFTDIFDKDILELIVRETNRYARQTIGDMKDKDSLPPSSRLLDWIDTNVEEMRLYFGVLMYMGIDPRTSLAEYWDTGFLEMSNFRSLMSYKRFILLNKFLYFVDNSNFSHNHPHNTEMCSGDRAMHEKVCQLSPLLTHLNGKFASLYNLNRCLSIDESLPLFEGRFGAKSQELCESVTGYMARFQIYAAKSQHGTDTSLRNDMARKRSKVLELLKGLERRGHCVTMHNFYNSPSLARYLKSEGFDCLGTLGKSCRRIPVEIAKMPQDAPKGTMIAYHSGDVSIVAWKESKVIALISTYHDNSTCTDKTSGTTVRKPKCVVDYNRNTGAVDLKEHKLSMYLLEKRKCMKWYLKMFKRLLNVSIHNAYVMFGQSLRRLKKPSMTNRDFRYALALSLVSQLPPIPTQSPGTELTRLRLDILHEPHYEHGSKNRKRCVICSKEDKRKMVNSRCTTCGVSVCFKDCWKIWHSATPENIPFRGRKRSRYE